MAREVVVLSAVRSAIGTFGGTLSVMEPADLGGIVMKAAIERAQVDPQTIACNPEPHKRFTCIATEFIEQPA